MISADGYPMAKGMTRAEATKRIVKLFVRKDAEAAAADAAKIPSCEGYSQWLLDETAAGRLHCIASVVDGKDCGSVWFKTERIEDAGGEYLNLHVAGAVLHGDTANSGEVLAKLVQAAKQLGCRTMTCKTVRPGLIPLLHRHGWEILSLEMGANLT